ncbi:hypothetical protein BGW39_000431 [Mortierella sp. 14UC]|nr:hypothetical protein BGW39_000431 [Mortierella sp. 14UC]
MTQIRFRNPKFFERTQLQGLRAANDPENVHIVPLHMRVPATGDWAFTSADVEERFNGYQDVLRETRDGDVVTVPVSPMIINIHNAVQQVMAFPSYPGEVLAVTQPGLAHQEAAFEQFVHYDFDMDSNEEPQEQQGYSGPHSSTPCLSSSSSISSLHSQGSSSSSSSSHPSGISLGERAMTNDWTSAATDRDVRLLAPLFVLCKELQLRDPMRPLSLSYELRNLKAYALCKNPRSETETETAPHFSGLRGISVKKPAEFTRQYTRPLLWNTMTFLHYLQGLKRGSQQDQEEYLRTTMMLKSDLDLASADDVEPLVNKTIGHLQELLPQDDALRQEHAVEPPPMSSEDASMSLFLEPQSGGSKAGFAHHGLKRVCNLRGREDRVCPSCYHRLYPSHDAKYIKNVIGADGEYDEQEGRIEVCPQNRESLRRVCRLDTSKIEFVAEFLFDLAWGPTAEDLQLICDISYRLGLTSLTISSADAARPANTHDPLLSSHSPWSVESSGAHLCRLAKALMTDKLSHLSVVSNEELDARAFLHDLQDLLPLNKVQVVTVSDPYSRYQAALCDGNIHLLGRESDLSDASATPSADDLNGKLLSFTMTNTDRFSSDEEMIALRDAIKTMIRTNPRLATLSLHCPAAKFHEAEEMMEILLAELASEQTPARRLVTLTLVDNMDDHVSASFGLPFNRDPSSIIANVTVHNHGPGLITFLHNYGPFIRVLNGNNTFGPAVIQALHDSIRREQDSQLTDVTLSLGDLIAESVEVLQSIFQLAQATLRQVTLVGAPSDDQVGQQVLTILNSLELRHVILFDAGSDMKHWVHQVQESLPAYSSLLVLDRVDELCRIMPGYDDANLEWIKDRQTTRVGVGASSQEVLTGSQSSGGSFSGGSARKYSLVGPSVHQARDVHLDVPHLAARHHQVACSTRITYRHRDSDIARPVDHLSADVVSYCDSFSWKSAFFSGREPMDAGSNERVKADEALSSPQQPVPNIDEPPLFCTEEPTEAPGGAEDNVLGNHYRFFSHYEDEPGPKLQSVLGDFSSNIIGIQRSIKSDMASLYSQYIHAPRPLFITLPEIPTRKFEIIQRWNQRQRLNRTSLSSNPFKLYFLCDGFNNTESSGDKRKHNLHLTGHKGYNIDRPNEFFKKYGAAILTVFQMIKHRVPSPGFDGPDIQRLKSPNRPAGVEDSLDPSDDDPPLGRLKLSDRPEGVDDDIDHVFDDLDARVDFSTAYIESLLGPQDLLPSSDTETLAEHHIPLNPVDLQELHSFLKTSDEERTLGNLYRTTTPNGHVKWACHDHYRMSPAAKAVSYYQAAINDLDGDFNEFTGSIRLKLSSQSAATRLYSLLRSSPPVQELDLSFGWSFSNQDLRDLRDAIHSTKAFHVRLDGGNHSPTVNRVSEPTCYDPLLQIMSAESIRSVELTGWDRLLACIETVPPILNVHRLKIQSEVDEKERGLDRLTSILKASPSLSEVSLDVGRSEHVVLPLVEALRHGGLRLKNLRLRTESLYSKANFSFVGGIGFYKVSSFGLRVLDAAKTKLLDIPSVRSVHIQGAQDLSALLARFDECLKTNSGLDSVLIEIPYDDLEGWLEEFQNLFAKYPHQRPRFCVSNGHSTLTSNNIQDHNSVELTCNPPDTPLVLKDDNDDANSEVLFRDGKQDGEGRELASSPLFSFLTPMALE